MNTYLELFVVRQEELDSDEDSFKQPLLSDWTLTEINENGMKIKLEFTDPLAISQESSPDLLLASIALSEFEDENGLRLPVNLIK